ncbi:hypothetical protein BT67DRAFT_483550 [Trichocladium antarcticum]|uniref:Urease accessory protein UreF n=1 Tax=Trichocladium antarcticum TaxID=1450529 RepID=A0AAN6ZHG7_9PEZI|nr:hypothetical protein BT67DRAFT_483550 [Trichocladium antarcticum]
MGANSPEAIRLDDNDKDNDEEIEAQIADLERRVAEAKSKRRQPTPTSQSASTHPTLFHPPTAPTPASHFLLLLSDSALPLGSFAFSSGLESYLAHQKPPPFPPPPSLPPLPAFATFLPLSLSSHASTTLPFVLAAHRTHHHHHPNTRHPAARLAALDDAQDATLVCTVGRRASIAQGRALLGIWERSFAAEAGMRSGTGAGAGAGQAALREFAGLLRGASSSSSSSSRPGGGRGGDDDDDDDDGGGGDPPAVAAHLAPLFGAVCALVGLGLEQTAYVFLLGHVKALVSAAVRAGVFGPYQAQKTLASGGVRELIAAVIAREWETPVEEAGQNVPVMDLWVGRHEVLYSRIFNS